MNPEIKDLLKLGYMVPLRQNLTDITGAPDKALVLTQMVYWSERATSPDGWFWKPAQELEVDLMGIRSRRTISDLLDDLVNDGWLERRRGNNPLKRAYWYRVNEEKLAEALRKWVNEHPETTIGESSQSIGNSRQSTGDGCQYNREHPSEITDSESSPTLHGYGGQDGGNLATASSETLAAAMPAIDLAFRQAYAVVHGQLWCQLDVNVRQGRSMEDLFGPTFTLRWTHSERALLQELLAFCGKQWPDRSPAETAAALVRSSLLLDSKVFQLLKFWINHNRGRLTLRPYLTLGGGATDPEARLDFLRELADNHRVQGFIQNNTKVRVSNGEAA